jgi:excisionase family DNA binding protein
MNLSAAEVRLLSVADVARLLGVTPRTVRRWSADGTLPAVRKGRRWTRWRLADVQRFLADHAEASVERNSFRCGQAERNEFRSTDAFATPRLTPALHEFLLLLARRLADHPQTDSADAAPGEPPPRSS